MGVLGVYRFLRFGVGVQILGRRVQDTCFPGGFKLPKPKPGTEGKESCRYLSCLAGAFRAWASHKFSTGGQQAEMIPEKRKCIYPLLHGSLDWSECRPFLHEGGG